MITARTHRAFTVQRIIARFTAGQKRQRAAVLKTIEDEWNQSYHGQDGCSPPERTSQVSFGLTLKR